MATKRIPDAEHQRPRRLLGELLGGLLRCPLADCGGEWRVIAYRTRTVRFECKECGLRWSLDPVRFGIALERRLHEDEQLQLLKKVERAKWEWLVLRARGIVLLSQFRAGQTPEERKEIADRFLQMLQERREVLI